LFLEGSQLFIPAVPYLPEWPERPTFEGLSQDFKIKPGWLPKAEIKGREAVQNWGCCRNFQPWVAANDGGLPTFRADKQFIVFRWMGYAGRRLPFPSKP
jgi:hypothetical protein